MSNLLEIPRRFFVFFLLFLSASMSVFSFRTMRSARPIQVAEQMAYFPSGKNFRMAGPTFASVVADMAWLQIVQYYGWEIRVGHDFSMIKPILFILTDIDPNFTTPYTLGAFILLDNAQDFEGAHELLNKGAVSNQDEWRYPFLSGFIYWISAPSQPDSLKNYYYALAGSKFRLAASKPEAPEYVLKFSSAAAKKTGEHLLAADIWLQLYDLSELTEERVIFLRNAKLEIERHIQSKIGVYSDTGSIPSLSEIGLKENHLILPDGSILYMDDAGQPSWKNR
ncbi:hypothetical protein JXL83_03230 [candidate division WOR-3 bacterium]|nr:hypothetical protein [candidate division WOR-3 bacterium]